MRWQTLKQLLRMKPKPRPIYVGDVIVGYDDGLPNSIKLDYKHFYGAASYIIWREGNTFYALNAKTKALNSGTDARAIIQGAIDAVKANPSRGTIYIMAGTYPLGTTGLNIYSGIALIGEATKPDLHNNAIGTILEYTGTGYAINFIAETGNRMDTGTQTACVAVRIENIGIKGTASGAGGIQMGDGANLGHKNKLRNVAVWGFTNGIGIHMNIWQIHCLLEDITLVQNLNGLYVHGGNANLGCNLNTFKNLWINGVGTASGYGIRIENEAAQNQFHNVNVGNVNAGIQIVITYAGSSTDNNVFYNTWAETVTTSVSIGSGVGYTAFIGGCFPAGTISDNGTNTQFLVFGRYGSLRLGTTLPKTAPPNPIAGAIYVDLAGLRLYIYDGTTWRYATLT